MCWEVSTKRKTGKSHKDESIKIHTTNKKELRKQLFFIMAECVNYFNKANASLIRFTASISKSLDVA